LTEDEIDERQKAAIQGIMDVLAKHFDNAPGEEVLETMSIALVMVAQQVVAEEPDQLASVGLGVITQLSTMFLADTVEPD
jgi:hypothetical protein